MSPICTELCSAIVEKNMCTPFFFQESCEYSQQVKEKKTKQLSTTWSHGNCKMNRMCNYFV